MDVRVIAKKVLGDRLDIYYLNKSEPKTSQLYLAIFNKNHKPSLTVYNFDNKRYEEVTALFSDEFIQDLSDVLLHQADLIVQQAEAL
ncbi:hypothetical protein ACFFIX_13745 [Metabacillus herbersteinensis]|uniref:Uncharacterized protein n=1 Tax=Metabacillus herbersteinensis TaxID=283816 RepID=A0ABV6GH50_9BACI